MKNNAYLKNESNININTKKRHKLDKFVEEELSQLFKSSKLSTCMLLHYFLGTAVINKNSPFFQ